MHPPSETAGDGLLCTKLEVSPNGSLLGKPIRDALFIFPRIRHGSQSRRARRTPHENALTTAPKTRAIRAPPHPSITRTTVAAMNAATTGCNSARTGKRRFSTAKTRPRSSATRKASVSFRPELTASAKSTSPAISAITVWARVSPKPAGELTFRRSCWRLTVDDARLTTHMAPVAPKVSGAAAQLAALMQRTARSTDKRVEW